MGRKFYHRPWMVPSHYDKPPRTDPWATEDDAGPISAKLTKPESIAATRCEFDSDGDLVYGEDVTLYELTKALTLQLVHSGQRIVQAKIFESRDKSLKGHTLAYTAYPYSRNDRGRASFKKASHHADPDRWQSIDQKLLEGTIPLTRIVDEAPYDLWRTSGDTVRCYILEPEQGDIELFSNHGMKASERREAIRKLHTTDDQGMTPDQAANFWADILDGGQIHLYGIVDDYEAKLNWLLTQPSSFRLMELTDNNRLFDKMTDNRSGMEMTPEAKNAAQSFLELSAHNVLCGTYGPEDYRGVYVSKRNRGTKRKQTLLTHLEHRFVQLMENFNKRVMNLDLVVQVTDIKAHEDRNLPNDLSLEDCIEVIMQYGKDLSKPAAVSRLREMRENLRQTPNGQPDHESLTYLLAMTVAMHRRGITDRGAAEFMDRLRQDSSGWDASLAALINEATAMLQQG